MPLKVVIVDYGMGNIQSVLRKFSLFGITPTVSNDSATINSADKIVLPGVGHFGEAMKNLISLNLVNVLHENVLIRKKPTLGICLGMQLMTSFSEEGEGLVKGLNWFDASVKKFQINDIQKYKVPFIGWNKIEIKKPSILMSGIENGEEFYFVHSFYCEANDEANILSSTNHEMDFVSAIEKENIFGVQYHPEKSHQAGERLINNFIKL